MNSDASLIPYNANVNNFLDSVQVRFDVAGDIWCNRRGFTGALFSDRYVIPTTEKLNQMKVMLPEYVEKITGMKIILTVDDIIDCYNRGEKVDELSHELFQLLKIKVCARDISLKANPQRNKTSLLTIKSNQENKRNLFLKWMYYGTVEKYEEMLIKKIMDKLGNARRNNFVHILESLKSDIYTLRTISDQALRNNFQNDDSCIYRYFATDVKKNAFYKQFNIINKDGSFTPACAFKHYQNGETVSGSFSYQKIMKK